MLVIAFVAFFALILAWLVAPTGENAPEVAASAPSPKLHLGEVPV